MIKFDEWWLPDGEQHLIDYLTSRDQRIEGRLAYQFNKLMEAMKYMGPDRRVAVDVGAHAGLWSFHLSKRFAKVIAFEPIREHQACWKLNMEGIPNAELRPYALGAEKGMARLKVMPGASMKVRVYAGVDAEEAPMQTLDHFALENVDFLKIDVEGYEYFVVKGGEETLRRWKPCVIVEQKPEAHAHENYGIRPLEAVEFLRSLGAKVRVEVNGDYILSWGSR